METEIKSPFEEQLTKVATWWADCEVLGQVVTESGTSVRKVWNGSGLQRKEKSNTQWGDLIQLYVSSETCMYIIFNVYDVFRQVWFEIALFNIYTKNKMRTECVISKPVCISVPPAPATTLR